MSTKLLTKRVNTWTRCLFWESLNLKPRTAKWYRKFRLPFPTFMGRPIWMIFQQKLMFCNSIWNFGQFSRTTCLNQTRWKKDPRWAIQGLATKNLSSFQRQKCALKVDQPDRKVAAIWIFKLFVGLAIYFLEVNVRNCFAKVYFVEFRGCWNVYWTNTMSVNGMPNIFFTFKMSFATFVAFLVVLCWSF